MKFEGRVWLRVTYSVEEVRALNKLGSQRMVTPVHLEVKGEGLVCERERERERETNANMGTQTRTPHSLPPHTPLAGNYVSPSRGRACRGCV